MPSFVVSLNGTAINPFAEMGLTQNPYPQVARSAFDAAERQLNRLGGEPIPPERAEAYIRETLAGFSAELVDLCVANYQPGKLVRFRVSFPESSPTRAAASGDS